MSAWTKMLAVLAATAFAVCLAACGPVEGQYQGHAARDGAELMEIAQAVPAEWQPARDAMAESDDMVERNASVASAFAEANAAYREGDYEAAVAAYQEVIADYDVHFGANVNLTLAQLQAGQDEEANEQALTQAIKCVYLFPDEPGCLLNAQVAATACGFDQDSIEQALAFVLDASNGTSLTSVLEDTGPISMMDQYYRYNGDWNRIETDLYRSLHPAGGGDALDPEDMYYTIYYDARQLSENITEDQDFAQLVAYIEAVGEELDLQPGS